jgi:hypothetical protein
LKLASKGVNEVRRTSIVIRSKNGPVSSWKSRNQLLSESSAVDAGRYSSELSESRRIQSLNETGDVCRILCLSEGEKSQRSEAKKSQLHFE